MQTITRDSLKKIFKKVKHLRLPKGIEDVDFSTLSYYSWLDQSDMVLYVLYEFKNELTGLRLEVVPAPAGALRLGFCEFCHKHRKQSEVFFVSTQTKYRPRGIEYRSRGTWVCSDYNICNTSLKTTKINDFFYRILEEV